MKHRHGKHAWIAIAVLCLGLAAATARPRHGGSRVEVRADRLWQDSGVDLGDGQGVVIVARGSWSHGTETGFEPYYGADGFQKLDSTALLPRVRVGTLLGRIGDGRPFPIGERLGLIALSEGRLWLAMNDVPGHFDNNQGSIEVWIEVQGRRRRAVPAATAAARPQ